MLTVLCADLSPSAANAAALALGRWAARHGRGQVEHVSLWSGSWGPAFDDVGSTWVVNDAEGPGLHRPDGPLDLGRHRSADRTEGLAVRGDQVVQGAARVLRLAGLARPSDAVRATALRRRLGRSRDPVWVAGAGAARLLQYVPRGRAVVVHQGAFDPSIDDVVTDPVDLALLRTRVAAWVAGSDAAADGLRAAGANAPIEVVPDLVHADAPAPKVATRAALVASGVPAGAALIAAYGEFDWWDVPDLFVPVAWDLVRRPDSTAHLVWVGGAATERMLWPLRHDLRHAGLDDRVHIAPATMRPADVLGAADVVAITRRGVVSPAQVREIQGLGVPTVRFAGQGETADSLGGSTVVPFPDDHAMVDALLAMLSDPDAGAAAQAAAEDLRRRHDSDEIAPHLLDLLGRAALQGSRPA